MTVKIKTKRVTIVDVAKMASVHPGTVSRVLNNSKGVIRISQKTREKIFEAASALNFHPKYAAQSLTRGTINTIGVYMHSRSTNGRFIYSYQADIIGGIEKEAYKSDFNIALMGNVNDADNIKRCKMQLLQRRIDGLILIAPPDETDMIDALIPLGRPLITIDYYASSIDTLCINIDNIKATKIAIQHLLDLGHSKIGFIGALFKESVDESLRRDGYLKALVAAGLEYGDKYVINGKSCNTQVARTGDYHFKDGYQGLRELQARDNDLTAVLCMNDIVAAGALRSLHDLGKKLPSDFSVIGFDDSDIASYTHPALTSVRHNMEDMGQMATKKLINAIQNESCFKRDIQYIDVSLTVRNSTSRCQHK